MPIIFEDALRSRHSPAVMTPIPFTSDENYDRVNREGIGAPNAMRGLSKPKSVSNTNMFIFAAVALAALYAFSSSN